MSPEEQPKAGCSREFDLSTAAKLLGSGRNRFCADLQARRVLDQFNLPYNTSDVDRGRLRVKLKSHKGNSQINNGHGQIYGKTYVTEKGLRWLAGLLGVEIEEADGKEDAA
ncbi:phage antirepressor KilAC domain-containing protein [Halopseudomonas oceani]|uniref:phage antirepressor KilAC domain-containing protein n=1 Tax=Halopseudomonas oceani TaxID=1708783 RepID=UPI002AA9502D|nr:phage antirepressor KilAC domain-containing protein [Halopseudomonas oceani]